METPSDEFVKFVASNIFTGVLTPARREYFTGITKRAFNQLVNERINERLKSVMSGSVVSDFPSTAAVSEVLPDSSKREDSVQTTADELEGFYIVKSLLRDMVDPARIIHRDTVSYMGILLDDNNRKPLARLHFNRTQKYLGIFDEKRNEKRVPIQNLNDIYQYAEDLRRIFSFYEGEKTTPETA
jgi:hypothetical protein